MGRALHMVQHRDLRDPVRSRMLKHYQLLIVNPSIPMDEVAAAAPSAAWAPTLNCTAIPQYGREGGLFDSLRDRMSEHYLIDVDGQLVKDAYGDVEIDLTFDAYYDYAGWIVENLNQWPALYLDQCFSTASENWAARRDEVDVDEFRCRWRHVRDYFLEMLKAGLPSTTLIGNVGGGLVHGGGVPEPLDAFTLEWGHVRSYVTELSRFASRPHPLNVAWCWEPAMSDQMDGVVLSGYTMPE